MTKKWACLLHHSFRLNCFNSYKDYKTFSKDNREDNEIMTQINSKNHFKLALFERCANRTQIRNEAATKQHEQINSADKLRI